MPESGPGSPLLVTTCTSREAQLLLSQSPRPPKPGHATLGQHKTSGLKEQPVSSPWVRQMLLVSQRAPGWRNGSQHEEGCPCPRVRAWMGREGLLHQPPWRVQGGEAVGPLLQDEDPRSMAEQTRNLGSRAPQPIAKEPPAATPWGGLPSLPSPASTGKRDTAPAPAAPGGTQPLAPQEGGGSSSRGRRRALAARTRSEIPSRGCPSPRARRLPAQAARGEGGIGARGLT